ncbi:MAG: hypothetical protein P8N76_21745 [Pirellulaceae bacterium]|nr:hypothetical protein [Pirellulaceae bacterium]
MNQWVEISFDCLPLRTISRFDVPMDASPKYRAFCDRIKAAIEQHGSHNSYYLHNARCVYHLLNDDQRGAIEFQFEGTVLTDRDDCHSRNCDLQVELLGETCDWLTESVVRWFCDTVSRSVAVEFDRYIKAGDLQLAKERIDRIQQESDDAGGFVGMYL